jgi:exodeoxyribonuclease VII small subunit
MAGTRKKKKPPFEQSLKRLEEIVEKLEGEGLSLEDSLALFEEGVRLAEECSRRLDAAEKKVSLLLKDKEGELVPRPFSPGEGDD